MLIDKDGILPGLGKKTQKQREDAFLKLLANFTVEQAAAQNLPERVDLMAFFDLLDEHNVQVGSIKFRFLILVIRGPTLPSLRTHFWGSPL